LISGISLGFVLWPINIKSYEPLIQAGGRKDLWWDQEAMSLWRARGVAKPPCRKWTSEFSDPFESLFLSHIIRFIYQFLSVEN
jgi:hypothetical protein